MDCLERVQNALSACDLMFADPDNGLYPDEKFKPKRKENAKWIPLYESLALAEGRTAVFYHDNTRIRGEHDVEFQNWMSRMPAAPMPGTGNALATGRSSNSIPIPK